MHCGLRVVLFLLSFLSFFLGEACSASPEEVDLRSVGCMYHNLGRESDCEVVIKCQSERDPG